MGLPSNACCVWPRLHHASLPPGPRPAAVGVGTTAGPPHWVAPHALVPPFTTFAAAPAIPIPIPIPFPFPTTAAPAAAATTPPPNHPWQGGYHYRLREAWGDLHQRFARVRRPLPAAAGARRAPAPAGAEEEEEEEKEAPMPWEGAAEGAPDSSRRAPHPCEQQRRGQAGGRSSAAEGRGGRGWLAQEAGWGPGALEARDERAPPHGRGAAQRLSQGPGTQGLPRDKSPLELPGDKGPVEGGAEGEEAEGTPLDWRRLRAFQLLFDDQHRLAELHRASLGFVVERGCAGVWGWGWGCV